MDSLQLAVMTVKIEAEFGVDVFADGVVSTVGDVEEKIRRYLAKHC
jgi:acyl carrier protein